MGDTEKPKVNSCFSCKKAKQEAQRYRGRPAAALALVLWLSTADGRFLEITRERERPVPNMNRLVVALTKPKQQLKASHSSSIAASPVTVSLLLPKRISSAADVYPTSDFTPPAAMLSFFSIRADFFWVSGAWSILFPRLDADVNPGGWVEAEGGVAQRASLAGMLTRSHRGVPPLCSDSLVAIGAKTCRGEAAEFLLLRGVLESQKFLRLRDVLPSALNRALLGYPERHEVFRRSDPARAGGSWGSDAKPVYIRKTVAAELSGVLSSREVNAAAGIGELLKHAGFLVPLAFGVSGCETRVFTSAFRVHVQCDARMAWSFAIGRFPHQVWFVSLIFTRDERDITSGQNTQ